MKIRLGFVSNSSSSSFCISNITNEDKKLSDFILENIHFVDEYNCYFKDNIIKENILDNLQNLTIKANSSWVVKFDDNDRTIPAELVFRRQLSPSGKSQSFEWCHVYDD
jgi:hypothetical protein